MFVEFFLICLLASDGGVKGSFSGFYCERDVNKLDLSNKCYQEDMSLQLSDLETNLNFGTP